MMCHLWCILLVCVCVCVCVCVGVGVGVGVLQVRHKVSSLTDPLVLREMAEELQRGPRGGGGGRTELVKQLSEDLEERLEGDHSFHSVVK